MASMGLKKQDAYLRARFNKNITDTKELISIALPIFDSEASRQAEIASDDIDCDIDIGYNHNNNNNSNSNSNSNNMNNNMNTKKRKHAKTPAIPPLPTAPRLSTSEPHQKKQRTE